MSQAEGTAGLQDLNKKARAVRLREQKEPGNSGEVGKGQMSKPGAMSKPWSFFSEPRQIIRVVSLEVWGYQ